MGWHALSIRISYLIRTFAPVAIAAVVLCFQFQSLGMADLESVREINWSKVIRFSGEDFPSLDWIGQQLTNLENCNSKGLICVGCIIGSFYASDLLVTGRRHGFCLVSSYASTSRTKNFFVWIYLCVGTLAFVILLLVLVYRQRCSWYTAWRAYVLCHILVVSIFSYTNKSFQSFELLVPHIEEKRQQRRHTRQQALERRNQRMAQEEKRRNEQEEIRQLIQNKQQQINVAAREIKALQSSSHDTSLATEAIANLHAQQRQLVAEMKQLCDTFPERA